MAQADDNVAKKRMDIFALLCEMARRKASDLFITAGVAPSFKINGKVVPAVQGVLTPEQAKGIVYGVMTPEQRRQFEASQECNFAIHRQDADVFVSMSFSSKTRSGWWYAASRHASPLSSSCACRPSSGFDDDQAWSDHRYGRDGFRQVNLAGGDGGLSQPSYQWAHRHD